MLICKSVTFSNVSPSSYVFRIHIYSLLFFFIYYSTSFLSLQVSSKRFASKSRKESLSKILYHLFCCENNNILGTGKTSTLLFITSFCRDEKFLSFLKIRVAMAHNFFHRSFYKPCAKKFGINIWEPIPIQRYDNTSSIVLYNQFYKPLVFLAGFISRYQLLVGKLSLIASFLQFIYTDHL